MVKIGDIILMNDEITAVVTALFQVEDGRWFIGYQQSDGQMGFFLEGDEVFKVLERNSKESKEKS
jgi:hypothetical protein